MNTRNGLSKFEQEVDSLRGQVGWTCINTEETPLVLDSFCKAVLKNANLFAAFRATNSESCKPVRMCGLDLLQQPIIGYFDRKNRFCVLSGLFSFQQVVAHQITNVPAIFFEETPPPRLRKRVSLAELTRILLDQQPSEGVERLRDVLCAWFRTDDRTRTRKVDSNEASNELKPFKTADIFSSKDWQSLYPGIKNKSQFCAWQRISSKTFKDSK